MRTLLSITIIVVGFAPTASAQRGCADTYFPKHLPPVNALLDSAAATGELAALQGPRPDMLFSLFYNEGDSLPVVRPLEARDAQSFVALSRALRPQKPSDIWAVRVHVAWGATPILTVERSKYCPPWPETRGSDNLPVTSRVQIQPGDRVPPSGRARLSIEVAVTKDGVPSRVRLIESSGIQEIDEQFQRDFETRVFHPALLDDVPIAGIFRSDGSSPKR